MKILIVGTGPSAYGALLKLCSIPNIEIVVVDNSSILENNFEDCIFEKNFDSGNRIPSNLDVYDKSGFNNSETGPFSSKMFGGYSNVWGGTAFPPSNMEENIYKNLDIDLEKYINHIYKNISIFTSSDCKDSSIEVKLTNREQKILKHLNNDILSSYSSNILINQDNPHLNDKNNICRNCNSFKWSCRKDTIWSTKSFIKDLIEKNKITYINNAELLSFKQEANLKVNCLIKTLQSVKNENFDKIFLGCGPINTSKIVMNSTEVNELSIKTCDMLSVPYVTPFFGKAKKHSFADIFTYFQHQSFEVFIQIYGFSKSLLRLASNVLPFSKFVVYFPTVFLSFFGGMFVYIDQDHSSKIFISKQKDKFLLSYKKESSNKNKYLKNLKKALRKGNVYPITFLSKEFNFGSSNHYGSQFPHSKENKILNSDRLGRILNFKNIHIIDSSVLPRVNVGPITLTVMANSYRIIEEVFET